MAKNVAKPDDTLEKAIQDGNVSLAEDAICLGAHVGPDDYGETALMDAALSGHLPMVKMLVEEMRQNVNAKSFGGATPLIRAAISGNLEVVRYLVAKGADLNASEESQWVHGSSRGVITVGDSHEGTALIAAVAVGSLEIVRFLLDQGADAHVRNCRGHNAFEDAIRHNRSEIVDFLLERLRLSRQTEFMTAVRLHLGQTKRFVEALGVSASFADGAGSTALMISARDGKYEFVEEGPHPGDRPDHLLVAKYLIERGCPINAQNRNGQTALMFAAGSGRMDLVRHLLKSGADPNVRDRKGKAAVDYVHIPSAPPEEWENASEAAGWEAAELYDIKNVLSSAMKAGMTTGSPLS